MAIKCMKTDEWTGQFEEREKERKKGRQKEANEQVKRKMYIAITTTYKNKLTELQIQHGLN